MTDRWQSMRTCPSLSDNRPFEAKHPAHGICRVRWMIGELVAKCEPPEGDPFFLHHDGNTQDYPTVRAVFSAWRPMRA